MRTKANLVAFLLLALFCCLARALQEIDNETISTVEEEEENGKEGEEERTWGLDIFSEPEEIAEASNKLSTQGGILLNRLKQVKKDQKRYDSTKTVNGITDTELRGRPRRKKRRRRNRLIMALLLAYKMKFIALIPTLLGGLILLIGKALLAGFFFALFAAVLGLKGH